MIEVEEAVTLLLGQVTPQTKVHEVALLDGIGRVTGKDIYASFPVPPFPKSAMDGYAVRSVDTKPATPLSPVKLRVTGQLMAGDVNRMEGLPGTAIRIMTGGEIPNGYDSVVKQENTDYGEEDVLVYQSVAKGENYCPRGEDIRQGQLVVSKNTRLTNGHIGIIASLGMDKIPVWQPMRVGIISTGSELRKPGTTLERGKVYNSCGYTLAAFMKSVGVEVPYVAICQDEMDIMCDMIREKLRDVDMLLTTGAISVGKKDIIPPVLEKLGARQLFKKVNMKPGTPVLANVYEDKLVLSLSGNPFAALTNFHLFFWPILARFLHNKAFEPKKGLGTVKAGQMKSSRLRRFVRGYEKDGLVELMDIHKSSVLSNLVACNCLVDQQAGQEIRVGDQVALIYLA